MSSFALPWGWGREGSIYGGGVGEGGDMLTLPGETPVFAQSNPTPPVCKGEQSCLDVTNSSCGCYCAVKCGMRQKTPTDTPIYLSPQNDPFGKGCYCAPRDLNILNHDNAQRCMKLERERAV